MGNALNNTGSEIVYSLSTNGTQDFTLWGNATANSWKTTLNLVSTFDSVKANFLINTKLY